MQPIKHLFRALFLCYALLLWLLRRGVIILPKMAYFFRGLCGSGDSTGSDGSACDRSLVHCRAAPMGRSGHGNSGNSGNGGLRRGRGECAHWARRRARHQRRRRTGQRRHRGGTRAAGFNGQRCEQQQRGMRQKKEDLRSVVPGTELRTSGVLDMPPMGLLA